MAPGTGPQPPTGARAAAFKKSPCPRLGDRHARSRSALARRSTPTTPSGCAARCGQPAGSTRGNRRPPRRWRTARPPGKRGWSRCSAGRRAASRSPYPARAPAAAVTACAQPGADGAARAAPQGRSPQHERRAPRPAWRAYPPARPAQADPGQRRRGPREYVLAPGQRRGGLVGRVPGPGPPAGGLAGAQHQARRPTHPGSSAHFGRHRRRRVCSCPRPGAGSPAATRTGNGWATAARARGRALAEPPRRLLRQGPGRKPVVPAPNGGARPARAARVGRPGRGARQRGRLCCLLQ
jgi:hypothetical protein